MRTFIIILSFYPLFSYSQSASYYDSLLSQYFYIQSYNEAKTALQKDSNDITAWHYLAKSAQLQYMEDEAERAWEQVLKSDSLHYEALNGLQKLYRGQDRFDDVLNITRRMDSLLPGQLRNWWILAQTENKLEHYRKSIFWCDTIIQVYKQFHKAMHVKALNLLKLNDTLAAIKIWRNLFHDHYKNSYLRQMVYTASSHSWNDTVVKDIADKLEIDSTNAYLYKMKGYLLYNQKAFADAAIMLRKAMELGDSTDFTRQFLGLSAFKIDDYSTTYDQLSQLPNIESNNSLFYMMSFSHARIYADTTSLKLLDKTLNKYYDPPFIASILNEISEASKTVFEKYRRRGLKKESQHFMDKAEEALRLSRKLHPTHRINLRFAMLYDVYAVDKNKALNYYEKYLSGIENTNSPNVKFARFRVQQLKEELHFEDELVD